MKLPWIASRGQGVSADIVDGWSVRHDGHLSACLVTRNIDLTELDESHALRALSGFRSAFAALDHELEFLVRVRPNPTTAGLFSDGTMGWERQVLVFVRVPQSETQKLRSAVGMASKVLANAGIGCEIAPTDCLEQLIADCEVTAHRPMFARTKTDLVRAVQLHHLPGIAVSVGWIETLLQLRVRQDVAIAFSPLTAQRALAMLKRRMRDHASQQMVAMHRTSMPDPMADAALDNVSDLRRRLAFGEARPLIMSVTTVIRGRTIAEVAGGVKLVRNALAQLTAEGTELTFRHQEAVHHASILATPPPSRTKLVTSDTAATAVPWSRAELRESGGYLLGREPVSLMPVQLDPFDAAKRPNANVAIFAASGQGKSYTVGSLLLEAKRAGRGAIIVDPEGEYRHLVQSMGGDYVELGRSTRGFNIFQPGPDPQRAADTLVEFTGLLCGGTLAPHHRSTLHHIAADVLGAPDEGRNAPRFVQQVQTALPEVGAMLSRLISRPEMSLFEAEVPVSPHNTCAFNLRDVHHELLAPLAYVVASWIWDLMTSDPQPRHIVFDEVGALSEHPALRQLLLQLSRRCRKYRAGLVVATQNVEDLMRTPEGSVIATNCATVLLGGHSASEALRMSNVYGLTEAQRHQLISAKRGRFLLITGDTRLALDIVPRAGHHRDIIGEDRVVL